ncbi:cysteine desulfurase [Candidatus Gottesmanbacteria bacterium]|nr:cysteine desulfurase [Candidatus Gottesmanbacteria bacterium]
MINIKSDFPIFRGQKDLVYLDSTATTLKSQSVINAVSDYYSNYSANVFRGVYKISEKATEEYEKAREKVANFIGAKVEEIIFLRNTTEALNLIYYSWAQNYIKKGDVVLTSIMEHHSNFVPWQQLCKQKGAEFKIFDIDENGKLILHKSLLTNVKLLALTHVSNVLGTINPVKEIIKQVRLANPNCVVVVDGAQAVPHMKINVVDLDCDFYCFSGHKMLGPTGIGVLWGKKILLDGMTPFNYGGEMISRVTVEKTDFKQIPYKFEAGTPHIAGAIALGTAIDYLSKIGMDKVRKHEIEITDYALKELSKVDKLKIYGPTLAVERGGVIAFTIEGIHPHDIAQILDSENICIRSGNQCAMPLHQKLGIAASARASFYIYTTKNDIDKLVLGLKKVIWTFTEK